MQPNDTKSLGRLQLAELATLLVKHHALHEGLYEVAFELQVAVGQVGPGGDKLLPGAAVGVSGMGLVRVDKIGPHTVDAAKVNPKPRAAHKAREKSSS